MNFPPMISQGQPAQPLQCVRPSVVINYERPCSLSYTIRLYCHFYYSISMVMWLLNAAKIHSSLQSRLTRLGQWHL